MVVEQGQRRALPRLDLKLPPTPVGGIPQEREVVRCVGCTLNFPRLLSGVFRRSARSSCVGCTLNFSRLLSGVFSKKARSSAA